MPGMTERVDKRRVRGERSREAILDAAERVMSHQGYNGTSIALISKETGLPNSSIYWHFASKSAILASVMERGAERFFEDAVVLPNESSDPAQRLADNLAHGAQALQVHRDFLRLLMLLTISSSDEDVQEGARRVRLTARRRLHGIISHAYAVHGEGIATEVADHLADYALASFDGLFFAAQSDPGFDLVEGARLLAQALHHLAQEHLGGPST